MSDEEARRLREENAELARRLAEAEHVLSALRGGQVDAIALGDEPVLLPEAHRALLGSERLHRALFEGALDAIVLGDDAGRCVLANPAAADLLGRSCEDLVGQVLFDLTATPREAAATWQRLAVDGAASGELGVVRPDGTRRVLEFRASAHVAPGRHLAVLRDVTDRRRLEQRLAQGQKMEAIGRLAGGVAHDFNNLLTAIRGFGDLLADALDPGDPLSADVREILSATDRASDLTRQLLALGRRQALAPTQLDPSEVVRGLVAILQRLLPENIALHLRLGGFGGRVRADRAQLEQVIMNLVLNARDAMPAGGTITVACERVASAPAPAPGEDPACLGPCLCLSVEDTGVGMTPEVLAHIFEPFYTTRHVSEGTGLGLATVHGVVTQSGGQIAVESAPGVGSVFRVYLTEVPSTRPGRALHGGAGRAPGLGAVAAVQGAARVLLVEDDANVRALTARVLERGGHEVHAVATVAEALTWAADLEVPLDLLVSDVGLAGGDGYALARQLQAARPSLRLVLMSGYPRGARVPGHASTTPDGARVLMKPFSPAELLTHVALALEQVPEAGRPSRADGH